MRSCRLGHFEKYVLVDHRFQKVHKRPTIYHGLLLSYFLKLHQEVIKIHKRQNKFNQKNGKSTSEQSILACSKRPYFINSKVIKLTKYLEILLASC